MILRKGRFGTAVVAAGIVAAAVAAAGGAATRAASDAAQAAKGRPILIGAAIDLTSQMAPVDDPALDAARLQIRKINARGGVLGRPLQLKVIDTHLSPTATKSAALDLIGAGAVVLWVSCDVDYATPAIQEGISHGLLTVSPCIGTDQMGPTRFGAAGKLAFSFGNVAQDEGAAMAEYAVKKKHWKTAVTLTDNLLVYFKNVCQAFTVRFKQLGGNVVDAESFTQGDKTIESVSGRVAGKKADMIAICTAFGDLTQGVQAVRTLGNKTPFLGPWSTDGSFWLPKLTPPLSGFYSLTFASVSGDDPSRNVRSLISQLAAGGKAPVRGGFLPGASAIQAIAAAMTKAHSTNGAKVAAAMQSFRNLPTVSGTISFSPKQHTVFGRPYRVMDTVNGKRHYVGIVKAGTPANIH